MGIEDRLNEVTKYRLCGNCLRQGHPISECRMGPCRVCNKRHNSLLHRPDSSNNNHIVVDESLESFVNFSKQSSNQIILSTAMIEVTNPLTQQKEKVRALLDCGSQSSFVSKSLKDKISLKAYPNDSLKVIGIGNHVTKNVIECCKMQIKSLNSKFTTNVSCLVLNELTGNIPKYPVNVNKLNLPKYVSLADPTFYVPAPIDILIGADLFWDILGNEQLSLGPKNPKLRSSHLGWIVSGPINSINLNKHTRCNHAVVDATLDNIENPLSKFWVLEEVPTKNIMSEKDKAWENHFIEHTRRNESGRFIVKLPLIDTTDCLGDTYKLAVKRLHYLEKRFKRNT